MATVAARLLKLAPTADSTFPDTQDHWAAGAIQAVLEAGIIVGFPDGTFRPDEPISRAEFAVVVNRLLGRAPVSEGPQLFSDLPPDHWAYGHVQAAALDLDSDGPLRPPPGMGLIGRFPSGS